MYESFFMLEERPFVAAPRADRYFPASTIEAARQALCRAIDRSAGVGLVIGPSGTGKSLLCSVLAREFESRLRVAITPSGRLATRRALLQAILFELGRPFRRLDEGELRLALIDYVGCEERCPGGLLLIVDEAQTLPLRLLEELRLLTNLVRGGEPRVRLVLAGAPSLEERFASPQLELFSQRFAARCYLEPLNRRETGDYVDSQLVACGSRGETIFTDDALDAVYQATDGIPRLINQVCDYALILAAAGGQRQIDRAGIEEAWSDLQQLPTAWSQPTQATRSTEDSPRDDIIEFGGLEEAPSHDPPDAGWPAATWDAAVSDRGDPDDGFAPAGSIEPEVEVVFPEVAKVDSGDFEEEEIVIDHYTEFDARGLGSRRVVSGLEGHELARTLAPLARQADQQRLRLAETGSSGDEAECFDPSRAHVTADHMETHDEQHPSVDDEPLIVVEEDPEVVELGASVPAPAVRRTQYKQLFVQLREG